MEDFEFFCVICGQSLCASLDLAGGVGECPTCLSMVPIPGYGSQTREAGWSTDAVSPEILSIEIVYRCEACGKPLQVDARWQGILHDCPECAAETRVPKWSGALGNSSKPSSPPASHPAHLTADEVEFLTCLTDPHRNGERSPIRLK